MGVRVLSLATDSEPLISRAMAAYFRTCIREGSTPIIPGNDSFLAEHDGLQYVVLQNCNAVLAVYRVRNNGILKELRRWPRELEP